MTRARGNKTSQAERELRRQKLLQLVKDNPQASLDQIADLLECGRTTLWRDLKTLTVNLATANLTEHQARVEAQEAALELMEKALLEERIEPEVANAWRQIRADIAQLRGLNAPSKSISVKADADPQTMGMYRRFLHETRFVPLDAFEEIWALCRKLSRPPTAEIQMIGPPDDSPLWHDDEEENADVEGTTDQGQELEAGADSDRASDLATDA